MAEFRGWRVHVTRRTRRTTKIFGPKFFQTIFFAPKIFFGSKIFYRPKFFFRPKIFVDPQFFFYPNLFGPKNFPTQNFFQTLKLFSGPKFLLVPKFFSDPKFFRQVFFSNPNLFGPKFFSGPKFFLTQNDFWAHFSDSKWTSMKTIFGGRKQNFWTVSFLNWQGQRFYLNRILTLNTKSWLFIHFYLKERVKIWMFISSALSPRFRPKQNS